MYDVWKDVETADISGGKGEEVFCSVLVTFPQNLKTDNVIDRKRILMSNPSFPFSLPNRFFKSSCSLLLIFGRGLTVSQKVKRNQDDL